MQLLRCIVVAWVVGASGWSAVAAAEVAARDEIEVLVDPRVELMSIIFRLAGNPEYNTAPSCGYVSDVEAHFGPHRDHAAVRAAKKLRAQYSVSYDAVISMALHVTDAFELKERIPLDRPPQKLDRRWKPGPARDFLAKVRQFVKDANFKKFVDDHEAFYEKSAAHLRKRLGERDYLEWFNRFFGARPKAGFFAICGLLNGTGNYGPSVRMPNGDEEIYMILGVGRVGADDMPHFGQGLTGLVVHEFCHSYVNHVVEKHEAALRGAGKKLFPHVKEAMKRQAYGNWLTVMKESCVRACTARYMLETEGESAARQSIDTEHGRSFYWTGELVELLDEYASDRKTFPTFEAFFPRVVTFFDEYAKTKIRDGKLQRPGPYGPINEALAIVKRTVGSAVVMPDAISDKALAKRVEEFVKGTFQRFYAAEGVALVTATEARERNLLTKPLILYGSPKSNAVLKDIAGKAGIRIARNRIKIGGRTFKGEDQVVIVCCPNPYNTDVPVVIYAAADDRRVININAFFHGPTDWLVGRWKADGSPEVVHQGNFTRGKDGGWVLPR